MQKDAPWLIVANQNMKRNIRCSLAYLHTRLTRIERMAWESGKQVPDHILDNLSPAETAYFKTYIEAIDGYQKSLGEMLTSQNNSLDLTVDFTPPKDLFLEVRINKDYGSVVLPESGEVKLQKNTTHLLRRSEVDHLIKRGIMAEVL